jgi:MlaC protein
VIALVVVGSWSHVDAHDATPRAEVLRDRRDPTDEVRDGIRRVFTILRDPALVPARAARRRELAVRTEVAALVDTAETSRRVLETLALTPPQRSEAGRLLGEMLTAAMGRITMGLLGVSAAGLDSDAESRVRYLGEDVEGDEALVHTTVVAKGDRDIAVTAALIRRGLRWLVYDLRINGVGLVDSYRAQCETILRRSSYAALADRLRSKRDDLVDLVSGSRQPATGSASPRTRSSPRSDVVP